MAEVTGEDLPPGAAEDLMLSRRAELLHKVGALLGNSFLLVVTSASAIAVLFIFYFIGVNGLPFFWSGLESLGGVLDRVGEFFGSIKWHPTETPLSFGALSLFIGSVMVTLGAIVVAVPLGVSAAICLSDVLPFSVRQAVKPVIEILAAIPSVAYGFFALVVFAPVLNEHGGALLETLMWVVGAPIGALCAVVAGDIVTSWVPEAKTRAFARVVAMIVLAGVTFGLLWILGGYLRNLPFIRGVNALNASLILAVMALPTVVSVSEDALQAVGRELREGSYALGATRAETMMRVVVPAASSGICAAVILGVMRAVGETMAVWMAAGNALQPPSEWFNYLKPYRTLTATIAAEMGETDQLSAALHYRSLFALGFCLLVFCFVCNLISEWAVTRTRKKLQGE
ncbi:MAG: PstC family ABC transporter permease [Planctomycetota bacterium]